MNGLYVVWANSSIVKTNNIVYAAYLRVVLKGIETIKELSFEPIYCLIGIQHNIPVNNIKYVNLSKYIKG